ncbi:MAG TPA: glycosyltransferase [Solirubrobacterales bacterium]|nr:glycosyltransferase [Solirubrobacterales bacterium]
MSEIDATDGAPVLVQYWHDEDVPPYIAELMATFRRRNPELRQLAFNEGSAARFIAERFGARQAKAFEACAVPAMQADYFRYCAVHALGGIYVDANFAAQRDLQPLLDGAGRLFELPPNGPVVNGLFAFRSPGHPLLEMAIEVATLNVEKRLSPAIGLTTGPAIFSGLAQAARGLPIDHRIVPVGPRMRPYVDSCWEALVESLNSAIERHGAVERALDGVVISPFAEMRSFVSKPDLRGKRRESGIRHWSHWDGPVFRSVGSETAG